MNFFDYIYYRTYSWYKSKNDLNYHLSGVLIVTLLQCSILFSLLTFLTLFFFPMPKIEKWQSTIFALIILFFNLYRYNKLVYYSELNNKWRNENEKLKYRKGCFIVFLLFVSIFFPILVGFLRHNLGLNLSI
jgi:hypothetical protein